MTHPLDYALPILIGGPLLIAAILSIGGLVCRTDTLIRLTTAVLNSFNPEPYDVPIPHWLKTLIVWLTH